MAFDDFFDKHHIKLQQYLQLLRYENSFQEVDWFSEHKNNATQCQQDCTGCLQYIGPVLTFADGEIFGEVECSGEEAHCYRRNTGTDRTDHQRAGYSGETSPGSLNALSWFFKGFFGELRVLHFLKGFF